MALARDTSDDGRFFTVVFEKNIRTIEGNPMLLETPFGKVISIAVGDWLEHADRLEQALEFNPHEG